MALDLSGLKRLDTSGLTPVENDTPELDLSGLTPLDTSGLRKVEPGSTQGRLSSAAGSFARGVGQGVSAVPKSLALVGAPDADIFRNLERIDRGQAWQPTKPLPMPAGVPAPVIDQYEDLYEDYRQADEPSRRAMREQLNVQAREAMQSDLYQAGESLDQWVAENFPANPEYQDEFWASQVPQALGSTVPFIAGAAATRGMAAPLGAANAGSFVGAAGLGSMLNEAQNFEEAIDQGAEIDEALRAADWGKWIGVSEAVPIGNLLNRLDKVSGGQVKRYMARAVQQGSEEAIQEAFSGIMNAAVAHNLYDPERGIWNAERGEEAAVGFTTGAILETLTTLALPGRRRGATTDTGAEDAEPRIEERTPEEITQFADERITELENTVRTEAEREELDMLRRYRDNPDVIARAYGNVRVVRPEALDVPPPTEDDIDSPIPTDLIQEGKQVVAEAMAETDETIIEDQTDAEEIRGDQRQDDVRWQEREVGEAVSGEDLQLAEEGRPEAGDGLVTPQEEAQGPIERDEAELLTPEQRDRLTAVVAQGAEGPRAAANELLAGKDPTGGMVDIETQVAALEQQSGLISPQDEIIQKAQDDFEQYRGGRDHDDRARAIEQNFGPEQAEQYRAEVDRLTQEAVAARLQKQGAEQLDTTGLTLVEPAAPKVPDKLYRGADRSGGQWATPSREAAEEYASISGGRVEEISVADLSNIAEPDDIRRAAQSAGVSADEGTPLYWLLTPEVQDGAERVIEQLRQQGFDAAHIVQGQDFTPSGAEIESYLLLGDRVTAAEGAESIDEIPLAKGSQQVEGAAETPNLAALRAEEDRVYQERPKRPKNMGDLAAQSAYEDQSKDWRKRYKAAVDRVTAAEAAQEPLSDQQAGPLRLEDYTDKSIIIRGETRENIDRIKAAGKAIGVRALWNKKAQGWVFPKKREAEVREQLADLLGGDTTAATAETERRAQEQRGIYSRRIEDIEDPAELRAYAEELRTAVMTDERTGLGSNRAWINREPKQFIASIDLDSLKWVNDNMGHDAGDRMIAAVGNALREAGLEGDAFHVSGDEFYAQADSEQALREAVDSARQALSQVTIEGNGLRFTGPGFSYGVAASIDQSENALNEDKQARETAGERAARGERPQGVVEAAEAAEQERAEGDREEAPAAGAGERAEPGVGPRITAIESRGAAADRFAALGEAVYEGDTVTVLGRERDNVRIQRADGRRAVVDPRKLTETEQIVDKDQRTRPSQDVTIQPSQEAEDGIQGPIRTSDEGAGAQDVQGADEARPAREPPAEEEPRGPRAVQAADEGRAETPERVPEGSASEGGGRAGVRDADRVPEREPAERPPAREAADDVKGENYFIESGALAEERGRAQKARDNIKAIELMRQIEAEGRPATREEQAMLARYVGWGGIKGAFPDADGNFEKGLEKVGEKLRTLLNDTEYATARRSLQYAHYTAENVVRSMWDAVRQLGFEGGTVFEPGMGTGNFAGMMPRDLAENTRYNGLELDHTTARIARLLYPQWGVRQDDFTKAPLPKDTFDVVIGNPPFADVAIESDPAYQQGFLLHDYFFAKSLDGVRPGGILAFVSSAGTMNKIDASAREYLADQANLVGAIRLPGTAFEKSAGTSVTTDIVILRKRLPDEAAGDRGWTETVEVTLPNREGKPITGRVSRYFQENPEMVLGEEGFFDRLYENRYAVRAAKDFDLDSALRQAVGRLPQNVMSEWMDTTDRANMDFGTAEKKEGSFYLDSRGNLMQQREGVGRPVQQRGKGVTGGRTRREMDRIRSLIPIKDALRAVYAADLNDDTANGEAARKRLNDSYDAFVAEFGPINKVNRSYRRPTIIQQESARADAREEARFTGDPWREGDFDASSMVARGASLREIARARADARKAAEKAGRSFDEGSFDAADMPDNIIEKRPNIDPFMDDPESYRLRSIEKYNDETGETAKRAVFFENIITKEREPEINSVGDALLHVLNRVGRFDLRQVAALSKVSEDDAIEQLGDKVYRIPGTNNQWVTREEYLSGNVRRKLRAARAAAARDPDLKRNVEALEAVQPAPLAPSEINANLGMPWIPTEVIQQFGEEALELGSLRVNYTAALALWDVDGDKRSAASRATWGTEDKPAPALIQDALNRQDPRVYREVYINGNRSREVDPVATEAAQDKLRAIKDKFSDWLWSDKDRATELANLYNEEYNNLVVREYDGSYLTTPGVSATWSWRPHQTRVIARIIQDGNTYMAHAVGAGKTSAMIGAGMEMRRLGLVRKPMYAVPNHMLGQFTKEFYEQYPTARIAVADERQFHTSKRKQFIADVANEDLDAVIITHSAFGMIPISDDFQDNLIQEQIDQYRELLNDVGKGQDQRITRSRLEKQIERLEQRLSGKAQRRQDQVFTFEEMGVDFLFVDEAHLFRKLDFGTKMSNVKGISPEGSKASWDLFVKSRYLESINPGRNLVLASGTPVTNTMAELFTVSRYLQPAELRERQLEHFDAWAGAFGDTVTNLEQDPAGGYKPVTRFAKFVNVPELSNMVRQVMDVVTSNQLSQYVTRPAIKGGKRQMNLAEKTDELEAYQATLAARMQAIAARRGPPAPGDDIILNVINDGRHASIDMRLVDPELPNDPGSKLNLLVDNVYNIWKDTKRKSFHQPTSDGYAQKAADKGPATQMVFANLGLSGKRGFSVPDYIRAELVRRGVPKKEIAFIADYKTHVAKQRLFNDMNEGKVRVLIGSTAKMATGVNAQRRLYAIHNLDPLWYPADDEQRIGRGLRQGNMNPEIEIHDYSTKGTYDSTMWGMMETKARFIQGFFEGDVALRDMEDLGEASQYEQAKAITTADPRLIELTDMRQKLERAQRKKVAFDREQAAIERRVANARQNLSHYQERVPQIERDIARRQDTSGENFKMIVNGKTFTDRTEAGDALLGEIDLARGPKETIEGKKLGEISGFAVLLDTWMVGKEQNISATISREGGHQTEFRVGTSANGVIRSLESVLNAFDRDLADAKQRLAAAKQTLTQYEPQVGRKFEGQDEIDQLREQVRELERELTPKKAEEGPVEDDDKFSLTDQTQTDTEAFKRWFGDSKVVDENGEPLVVYHGTAKDFDAFSEEKRGTTTRVRSAEQGFFFTDDPSVASDFADFSKRMLALDQRKNVWPDDSAASVMPTYLSLQNPMIVDGKEISGINDVVSQARDEGKDGLIIKNVRDTPRTRQLQVDGELMDALDTRGNFISDTLPMFDEGAVSKEEAQQELDETVGFFRDEVRNATGEEKEGLAQELRQWETVATAWRDDPSRVGFDEEGISDVYVAFNPEQIKSATGNRGTFDPTDPRIQFSLDDEGHAITPDGKIVAYHGTPHDFDRFDISKIGTGEGAQAFGHGLYFAGSESVANYYKDMRVRGVFVDGAKSVFHWVRDNIPRPPTVDDENAIKSARNSLAKAIYDGVHQNMADPIRLAEERNEKSKKFAEDHPGSAAARQYQTQKHDIKYLRNNNIRFERGTPGNLYQVEINANPDELLDWDKSLDDQPQIMQKIEQTDWGEFAIEGAENAAERRGQNPGGDDLIRWLQEDGPDFAMEQLREAGIKGIKYKDAVSRGKEGGTYNYVIFDDTVVDIAAKWSVANMTSEAPTDTTKQTVREAIQPDLDAIADTVGVDVRVISSNEMPEAVARQVPAGARPKGFTIGNQVHLIADNIRSKRDARVVFAHEVKGHYGVNNIVDNWDELTTDFQSLKKSRGKTFDSIYSELQRRYGQLDEKTEVKEFIAIAAERRVKEGPVGRFMRKVREAFKAGLKRLGIKAPFSMTDIDIILSKSEQFVQGGAGTEAGANFLTGKPVTQYALQPGDFDPERARRAALTFDNPESEARWQEARKGVAGQQSLYQRVGDRLRYVAEGFARHYIDLPNQAEFSQAREQLRKVEAAPQAAKEEVLRTLKDMTKGMSRKDVDLFTRKVVLDDLTYEVEREHQLPFGFTPEDVTRELAKVDAALTDEMLEKVRMRNDLVRRVADDLVEAGVLSRQQIRNPAYYRHQVLDYARAQVAYASGPGKKLQTPKWARRMGSRLDINANLLEAEFEWMQKALTDIAVANSIQWFKNSDYNIRDRVVANARQHNQRRVARMLERDIEANGFRKKSGELTSPLTEEWKGFKQRVAVGLKKISDAIESGQLYDFPSEFNEAAGRITDPNAAEGNIFPFLAWILDNNAPGAEGAAQAFKAINQRKVWMQHMLGDQYADPMDVGTLVKRGFAPEGYKTWQPDEGNLLFTAKTIPEHVIDRMLDKIANEGMGVATAEEMRAALESARSLLVVGGPKYQMVLPEGVADTLNSIRDDHADGMFDALAAVPLSLWKRWVLINPRRVLKYNLNNLSGDLDGVIAGNPRALKKLPRAIKELYQVMIQGKAPSARYREAVDHGVFDSGLTIQEIPDINYMSEFEQLIDPPRPFRQPLRFLGSKLMKVWRALQRYTWFRENWLRYAAYLDYVERLEAGESMESIGYGAAKRQMVDALGDDHKAKGALLSRELVGDYGAISHFGKDIRRKVIPFYSWMEINTKRYWRLGANAWDQGIAQGFRTSGIIGASLGIRTTAYLTLRMAMLYGMVQLWNHLVMGDEEDELSAQERARLHLTLGKTDDGEIRTLRFQGALSDFLNWLGFEDAIAVISEIEKGRASYGELMKVIAKAPVQKVMNGITPIIKMPLELLTGQSYWPDVFQPWSIRDKWRHLFKMFSLEHEYDVIFDRPSRGYGRSLEDSVTYKRDLGENAYNQIKGMTYDWLRREKGMEGSGGYQTPRSKALYEWRLAKKFGDRDAERKAFRRLRELGVSDKDLGRSIQRAHPLGALALKDRPQFKRTLTSRERKMLEQAKQWYKETYTE